MRLRWKPRAIPIELRLDDSKALARWNSLARWRIVHTNPLDTLGYLVPQLPEPEEKFVPHLAEGWWTTWTEHGDSPWWDIWWVPRNARAYRALLELQELGVVNECGMVVERDDNERQN